MRVRVGGVLPATSPTATASWKGWLFRSAKREAWRLNALEFKEREAVRRSGDAAGCEPVDPHDRLRGAPRVPGGDAGVEKLPPLLQEVVVIRSQVWQAVRTWPR